AEAAAGEAAKAAAVLPEAAAQAGDGNAKGSPFLNGREARFKPLPALAKARRSHRRNENG
ncbi:hypothetical protein, partial [Weizmannia sp. CD-2023]|uniref:hypothetical protein n=1 Tax=Weizmannia sp. CD-2023 TaxID=3037263 RepID=UPI002E2066D0|nr:hypothetical protein [Weizmannia sp. CD-2023]